MATSKDFSFFEFLFCVVQDDRIKSRHLVSKGSVYGDKRDLPEIRLMQFRNGSEKLWWLRWVLEATPLESSSQMSIKAPVSLFKLAI
jgi:hypothetical protein